MIKKIILLLSVIFLIYAVVGFYFYRQATYYKARNNRDFYQEHLEKGYIDRDLLDSLVSDTVSIATANGYDLYGIWFYASDTSQKTIVMTHGHGANLSSMFKYYPMFKDAGINLFLYDIRGHGKSGGETISYGVLESKDLQDVLEVVTTKHPTHEIGLLGESLGGAIVLQYAAIDKFDQVKFYIADCSYSSIVEEFDYRLNIDYGLPNIGLVKVADTWNVMLEGVSYYDASPKRALESIKKPFLIVHGGRDYYTPVSMAKTLSEVSVDVFHKTLIVENGRHAGSIITDPKTYKKYVDELLEAVDF